MKVKQKYWYITELHECVLCGCSRKEKYRVYEKPKQSVIWMDFACQTHFM